MNLCNNLFSNNQKISNLRIYLLYSMPKTRKRKTSQVPMARKIRKVASELTAQGANEEEL